MDAEHVRLFVALELPPGARAALERWQSQAIRSVPGLRALMPEALHATLCFLGWRSEDEIESIGAACSRAVGELPPPALAFTAPLWLPRRRPRVLAVGLQDRAGALGEIQAALSAALCAGGWYRPEKRPFLAHVTVARVPGRTRVRPADLAPVQAERFESTVVTLYRSRLGSRAARYEALRRIELR